ncbi:MAG: sporulation protein YqfD [Clostridia bacterium]|nr:sporulation protein YqfD [Clostridia bacterium]
MRRILHYLLGYVKIKVRAEKKEACINLLRDKKMDSWDYFVADDTFFLSTTRGGAAVLAASLFENETLDAEAIGLLPSLWHARNRVGLLLGALTSALIFLWLSSYVWDVRVEGNLRLSNEKVLEQLEEAGLSVGTPIRHLDQKQIAGDVLLASDELSFVRINMNGTVAHVTVRERDAAPDSEKKECANLVAKTDATVEILSVSAGNVQVHSGQVVKRGDILVSGITEGLHGSRLVRAKGEVYGRVERTFTITVPAEITVSEEEYTKTTAFSFLFFGKSINIYRNTGNLPASYATIYHGDAFYLGDSIKLPFGVERSILHAYTDRQKTLTEEEQVRLAYSRLGEQMLPYLQNAELLSKSMYGSFGKEGYTLTCALQTLENIALTQEFSAN